LGRWALTSSALAAGIDVGLFNDEVGTFPTESNDHLFAPAAPIIYGTILLLVLVWLRTRPDDTPSLPEATQGRGLGVTRRDDPSPGPGRRSR
jgi:hypothetical protein